MVMIRLLFVRVHHGLPGRGEWPCHYCLSVIFDVPEVPPGASIPTSHSVVHSTAKTAGWRILTWQMSTLNT